MDPSRFDFLLNLYLDAELSPEEKSELQTVLLSDPEARRQFWRDTRVHGSLRLLAEQKSGAREALSDVEKPGKNRVGHARQRIWFGAAASAAAAALVVESRAETDRRLAALWTLAPPALAALPATLPLLMAVGCGGCVKRAIGYERSRLFAW